ncbi:MAG: N-acetylmuramoyl-L-alanine amidase [Alphaproteobacteria bacterium]|nr:N-acetylmuramoyl-L-alanine amidase [Alphaproteobacteria bacterium]
MVDRPSPNNDARAPGQSIDMLILHYTGMTSTEAALDRLCDPDARVSAHYLVDELGTIHRLVPDQRRAWHAGVSSWAGDTDVNDRSIGIELSNPGHEFGYRPFAEVQMTSLEALTHDICRRHGIAPRRVLGHADVAPSRKQDPGEFFDWRRLAAKGIGLWPSMQISVPPAAALGPGDSGQRVLEAQAAFAAYGYGIKTTGEFDQQTVDVVIAFQRHFRPQVVDGAFDHGTEAALRNLVRMVT